MTSFGARLQAAIAEYGGLVVGIDPHPGLLAAWGLDDSADGAAEMAGVVIDALAGRVAMVKPQAALFERFGSSGIAALEDTLELARDRGLLTLLDAKRGDIGSTMVAYAESYLGNASPLAADAVTLSPYLGFESLRPALALAAENERGVFVLALTSNPEGAAVQHAGMSTGRPVAAGIADAAAAENAAAAAHGTLGSVGLVVGATIGTVGRDLGIDFAATNAPLLAPGVGAQGATMRQLTSVFGAAFTAGQVLPTVSRAVLAAGPRRDELGRAVTELQADLTLVRTSAR
ncbi:orotidine-5'-phosphate decarboxylase [Spelaeicoccus albus]|uniref:Orotidine-5'-phosphate decarboxylase n=1 Tax=Spelaeicoccus albus TaxID=1280376 RepID=A0A7Z0D4A5_9MICO|nr:orotidine-5'-phosphate decarboxylase [Spelaeicoccus albus]NYI68604.1 orotidine-5'-phosphate decarboxylase [Spelaeicoccus albus]